MSDCFFFFSPLRNARKAAVYQGCVHTASLQLSAQWVEPIPLAAAGLEIVSQLDVSASASMGLSVRVRLLRLPFGWGGISTALQPVKKIQVKWRQKVLAKALWGEVVWRGHLLFGLILGIFSQRESHSEYSSCTEPCFVLNLTKNTFMSEWLKVINNFNAVCIIFVRESQVKHAVD